MFILVNMTQTTDNAVTDYGQIIVVQVMNQVVERLDRIAERKKRIQIRRGK